MEVKLLHGDVDESSEEVYDFRRDTVSTVCPNLTYGPLTPEKLQGNADSAIWFGQQYPVNKVFYLLFPSNVTCMFYKVQVPGQKRKHMQKIWTHHNNSHQILNL